MTFFILALLIGGLLLLAAEVFVIPGFGVAGVLGIASLVVGTVLAFRSLGPLPGAGILLASVAIVYVTLAVLPRTRMGKSLVLEDASKAPAAAPDLAALVGQTGVALTSLRPAGTAEFSGERVDVVTEGEYIESGARLRVQAVEGARVVVREETV